MQCAGLSLVDSIRLCQKWLKVMAREQARLSLPCFVWAWVNVYYMHILLTIWVHMISRHLGRGEPLLERIRTVTIRVHGHKLLLLRRGKRCVGVHETLHSA